MFNEYFIVFLLGHVLGDFYMQTVNIAERKKENFRWILLHSLIYGGGMLLVIIPVMSVRNLIGIIILSLMHFGIDAAKYGYVKKTIRKKKMTKTKERNIFCIDQLIHTMCILIMASVLAWKQFPLEMTGWFLDYFNMIGLSEVTFVRWLLAILLIHKPANILISKVLMIYRPVSKEDNLIKRDNNAGRFIGILERSIMLIFLAIGQYSAIGLVLTAKSIARYDRISKEKDFAEYYLLGTLLSTMIVVVTELLLLKNYP